MKNKIGSILLLFALLAALVPSYDASAQGSPITVEIQPDGDSMKDAIIIAQNPNNNYSTLAAISVGESNAATWKTRSLLEFDLSGLPYDMLVQSATLVLTVSADYSSNTRNMNAYAINTEWTESQVKWNYAYNGMPWQTAGAEGSLDVITEPIGSVSVADNLAPGATVSITLSNDAVQAMRLQNYFGLKLQMETENNDLYDFYSSDDATATNRPKLIIEYIPDPNFEIPDTKWVCVNVAPYAKCNELDLGSEESPYTHGGSDASGVGYDEQIRRNPQSAAKLLCDPYPRCVNDYPIYYRLTYDAAWTAAGSTNGTLWMTLEIPGGADVINSVPCGVGVSGKCKGVFEGEISIYELPQNYDGGFTIGLDTGLSFPSSWFVTPAIGWTLYLSLKPFDQDCAETWYVPVPDTYVIDPTLETPLGPLGTPADYQIYPTEIGQVYMVRVEDGPWNDGTDDRSDAAVSFDGIEWLTWEEFSVDAICIDVSAASPEDDYRIIYFEATTEEFHIRVNDEAAAFGDNTNDPETPYQYVIGMAFELDVVECESQFTWDPENDLLASVVVNSQNDGGDDTYANNDSSDEWMQVGEWYAVQVVSGTWSEPSSAPRVDMEYFFLDVEGVYPNTTGYMVPEFYTDLAEGSPHVQCASSDIVFVQAAGELLNLRVNDQSTPYNFANNSGSLTVSIFHTTFERPSETCELNFSRDQLVRQDDVNAKQQHGKVFALTVGSVLTNNNTQTENFLSEGLVPGAWYVLETTGGPWGYRGSGVSGAADEYDLAIVVEDITGNNFNDPLGGGNTTPDENWVPLAEWDGADCNIEIDKLGHRLVYFQMPVTDAKQYKLRVNDSAGWTTNTGSMSWNLYRAIDLGPDDSGLCDYTYSAEDQLNQTVQTVRADAPDGAYISSGGAIGQPSGTPTMLLPNTTYAVELLGEDFKWYEENGGDPHTDMELSLNNGTSWADLPGGALCALTNGENYIFFVRSGNDAPKFKLRVNSTTFEDNYGFMGYNIYSATAGSSINPYDGCVTSGYSTTTIGDTSTWIPVTDPMGIGISSTSASYAEIAGLVPGNRYIVEVSRGPWFDGETTYDNSENLAPLYKAQVSSDGGTTWNAMDGTNPNVTCWEYTPDFKYYKIEFTVQSEQLWRIRVADTDSAVFDDNTGQLAFTLKGLVQPADTSVTGTFTLAGCNTPPILPDPMSASDFLNVGNYLAEWIDYAIGSIIAFTAWCPEDTAAVTMFAEDINDKDPFAFFDEMNGVLNDIKNEINGYGWGTDGEDYSVLTKSPAQSAAMIEKYIFGPLPADSPWLGGELVHFEGAQSETIYYGTCQLALVEYVGPLLGKGVCFASDWAREIGFTFYIQLMLDVGIIFAAIRSVSNTFKRLIYLFTGVNTSVMSSDAKVFVNVFNEKEGRGRR